MDPERFEELIRRLHGEGEQLSVEEMDELEAAVRERLSTIDRENPTDDDVQVATEGGETLAAIREVRAAAEALAAERRAQVDAALSDAGEPAVEAEQPAEGPEGEAPAAEAPEAPAAEAAEPPEGGGEPETAAGGRRLERPRISHLAHRMPTTDPDSRKNKAKRKRELQAAGFRETFRPRLLASADMPGLAAGGEVDVEEWASAAYDRIRAVLTSSSDRPIRGEKVYLGKIDARAAIPENRMLHGIADQDEDKVQAVLRGDPEAIAASGGVCGPVGVDYTVTNISAADRPARDGAMNFGAARGGLRYILPHTLAMVTTDAPSQVWTAATDAAPGNNTKAHATFACQAPQEKLVDAITSIVEFGNFQARYFPEQVAAYLETVDAVHARVAEATLLADMVTASTAVNAGNNGTNQTGAATEFLAELDRASAARRYVHRMAPEAPLQLWYPEWFEDMMRADLAREMPGNSGGQSERLAVADAELDRFLEVRDIEVVNFLDNPTGYTPLQGWAVQPVGDLWPWPTKVLTFLTHPGAYQHLDGGELNLGMVRDSVLNQTNDFQMFSETFEKQVFRGHFSLAMTLDLCPDGGRAALVDTTTLCSTGS